jgi:PAS domain S-box-containing protein
MVPPDHAREIETARLLLAAARYLGETLDPQRVYERFRELMAEAIPHNGVIVSSYDDSDRSIRCDYAWIDGEVMDVSIFPPLTLQESGGMQSEVIRTGQSLLTNDVARRVQDSGTYYDVDAEGNMRKVPDEGAPNAQAAMMVPIRNEGKVVGVVQLMSEDATYDEGQLELAEGMVAQLAASVRNARLHEERLRLEAAAAATEAATAERERAVQLLEAVGDGIFFVADDGRIGFWNRVARTITGLDGRSARGKRLSDLPGGWEVVAASVLPASTEERPRAVTLPIDAEGHELWLSFVAVRTHGGVVYAFRDMTPERQLEQSKHDFIATVSHELRTPMTGVLGAARTLLREDLDLSPEVSRQLLEMIASQASRLAEVTESVLLAGRLDRQEVSVESQRVDIDAVVRATLAALEPSLPEGTRLETELGSPGPALGDIGRLQQVLVNLVDNGVKYSPDGGAVTVRTTGDEARVRIEVVDSGYGIEAADRERIFEKFVRSANSHTLAPGGTGLGLYISRELVERMGGRLTVSSTPGAGSTFSVELRVAPEQ